MGVGLALFRGCGEGADANVVASRIAAKGGPPLFWLDHGVDKGGGAVSDAAVDMSDAILGTAKPLEPTSSY